LNKLENGFLSIKNLRVGWPLGQSILDVLLAEKETKIECEALGSNKSWESYKTKRHLKKLGLFFYVSRFSLFSSTVSSFKVHTRRLVWLYISFVRGMTFLFDFWHFLFLHWSILQHLAAGSGSLTQITIM